MSVTNTEFAPTIIVRNTYNAPMTAFVVAVDLTGTHRRITRLYFDVYVNDYEHAKAIPPGGAQKMPLPRIIGEPLPVPTIEAAIFEDGATWGAEPWVNELLEMRSILWKRLGEASGVLRSVVDLPPSKVTSVLRWEWQFRSGAVATLPAEKQLMHDRPFSMALKNLDENSRVFGRPAETKHMIQHFVSFFDTWRTDVGLTKPSVKDWSPTSPDALDLEAQSGSSRFKGSKAALLPAAFHPGSPPPPLPTCTTTVDENNDAKKLLAANGICGNQTWELIADFSGQLTDKGSQEAFGVCTGGFTDCFGVAEKQGVTLGDVHIFHVPSAPSGTIGFGWSIDSWVDMNTSCQCSDPFPNNHNQSQANHTFPTPNYFVSCQ